MWERYRRVLRAPHVLALVLSSVLARTPIGMISLALVLYVERLTGSFGAAGGVTAAFAVSAGLASPLLGRMIDRVGHRRVLVPCVVVHAAAILAVVALGESGAGAVALGAVAAVAGAGTPPVSAALRPLWPGLLDDEALLPAAYALDSILIEAVFSFGPLLTAALVALFSPAAALVAGAAIVLAGTLWFTALPPSRAWRGEPSEAGWAGPLHAPGMRTLLLVGMGAGGCFGVFEVALPAFGADHGSASLGGPFITAWALGSALGGVLYGAFAERLGSLSGAFLRLAALLPLVSAVTLVAPSALAMLLLVPISGIVIAPLQATQNQLVGVVAPAGTITEAYTWVLMGLVVGVSVGNAIAGALVDASGWRAAILVGCGLAALGAVVAWARRGTLRPAAAAVVAA
jgi:MFS family permease